MLQSKLEHLRELLRGYGSCLIAYSGGVDSVLLARVAHDVLGPRMLAVIADSPSLPRSELQEAVEIARQFEFPLRVVRTSEFDNPAYLANSANRCYFCKHELFTELHQIASREKFSVVAYGENVSDAGDFRPGGQAAAEFEVRAPLKEAGLTKEDIRELSSQLGLPTAEKPQMACLSSRIPHGEPVTQEKLRMVEAAERVLRDLGFYDVRVRHHELGSPIPTDGEGDSSRAATGMPASTSGRRHLARIEVGSDELARVVSADIARQVVEELKRIGYAHVTIDLQGYRRGSATGKRPNAAFVSGGSGIPGNMQPEG